MENGQRNDGYNQQQKFEQEVCLLGQPPLRRYLKFVEDYALDANTDRRACADEWRRANDYYRELEDREAGIADKVEVRDLPASLAPLAETIKRDARFRRRLEGFVLHAEDFGIEAQAGLQVARGQNHVVDMVDHHFLLSMRSGLYSSTVRPSWRTTLLAKRTRPRSSLLKNGHRSLPLANAGIG